MLPKYLTYLIFSIVLIFSINVFAGDDFVWKPITPAELAAKEPLVEKDADAEAIFWEVKIDDSKSDQLSQEHYVRVKIYTERGREKYSKFDIPYYKGLKIKNIAARVIKPDGSIVEITEKDIFDREIIKADKIKIKAKSFAIPNIEPGVIVEYHYRQVYEDEGAKGMSLEFQKEIPVQRLAYYYKPFKKQEPVYQSYNFSDTKFYKDDNGYYLAERKNVPAFKEEPRMPPEDSVRPWILLQGFGITYSNVSMYGFSFSIKDPTNPRSYWAAVGDEYTGLTKYMNKPEKDILKAAQEATAGATNDEEKLRKLYDFTQTQFRNLAFDSTLTDEQKAKMPKNKELKDILKTRVSSSGQYIDMIFGAMASSLGFESRIVLSANRQKMIFEPSMTNESFLHAACIAVFVGGKWKYFNPSVPFLPYGQLVWYEQDVYGLLVGESKYLWQQTPLLNKDETSNKRFGKFKLLEDGTLEGEVRIEQTGNDAIADRLDLYDETQDKQLESVKESAKFNITTAEISDVSIENMKDAYKPLVYRYKVRVPNYAQKTGKRLFLQPGFFEYGANPTFSSSTRKYKIYFRYPWSELDDIEIALPPNYVLDNADAPNTVQDPDKIGVDDIHILVAKDGSFIKYNRKFHFGGNGVTLFDAEVYQNLKNIFDSFHKADSHTITLKQKQ
jgi:hypothetical protein